MCMSSFAMKSGKISMLMAGSDSVLFQGSSFRKSYIVQTGKKK